MTPEKVAMLIGGAMRRNTVLAKYGGKIKQLNTKDGRWWIRVDGRLITKNTYEAVIEELMKLENLSAPTLDGIAKDWLISRRISKSAATFRKDKINYERFIKGTELAKIELDHITLKDGYAWVEDLLKKHPMRKKYWKNIHGTLNSIMKFAGFNTLQSLEVHKDQFLEKKRHKDESRIFLPEEKKTVKALAYKDAEDNCSAIPLGIPFIFCTGVRDGELCALHWRDVDFSKGTLHIQSEMVEDSDDEGRFLGYKWVDHCKSEAGDRIIPLSKEVVKILHLAKKYNFANGIPVNNDSFIFMRSEKDGIKPCTTRSFECRIKKYCRHAGMTELKSQHDARRTFATDCFYSGMNSKDLQKLLGHNSLKQTEDYIYTRPGEDTLEYLDAINM